MQSLKCLLTVGVAVCALSVRGGDTDAQAKAREALEKKLNEVQGQPATPAAPAKPVAQPQPPKPRPAKQATDNATAPAVNAPAPADPDSIAKAREAMREKMSTLQPAATEVPPPAPAPKILVETPAERPPTAAPPPPPAPAPAAVAAPAAAVVAAPVVSSAAPAAPAAPAMADLPPPSDPQAIAKAREALRQKMNELQAGQPAPVPQPTPTAPSAPAVPAAPAPSVAATAIQPPSTPELTAPPEADPAAIAKAREAMRLKMQTMSSETPAASEIVSTRPARMANAGMNFPPLQAPPLPISAAKDQRLQQLLQQYRADLISPEQYQAARAKILAEP